jgi:ABC-type multidrug transport system fused ATPase/permease subunit
MFGGHKQIERWFHDVVERFRQKGAISPDRAMTAEELDLPPRFEEAMKRRLGRSGVFVEVNGKYYLSEERLKQIEEMRSAGGGAWNPRSRIMSLRLVQLITIVLFVILFLVNLYVQSWELRLVSAVILVVWLLIAILQIYYLSQARKRFSRQVSKTQQTLNGAELMNNMSKELPKIGSTTSRLAMFYEEG